MHTPDTYTALVDGRLVASGDADQVALVVRDEPQALIFADRTGERVEFDARTGRLALPAQAAAAAPRAGRGRPRLGVVAREVTLLPRHWEWLATQPGGASAALRRLVDEARRDLAGADRARQAQRGAYAVMSALAGDLPGFEEASRALFAGQDARLDAIVARWPAAIGDYVLRLARAERE